MSEELIKKSDAIKAIKWWFDLIELNPDILIDSIITMPTTEPKRGEWIDFKNGWKCSACGKWNNETTSFCPNCGARMKGADDE